MTQLDRSGESFTRVTVRIPTRGSLSSWISTWAARCWMVAASLRLVRLDIGVPSSVVERGARGPGRAWRSATVKRSRDPPQALRSAADDGSRDPPVLRAPPRLPFAEGEAPGPEVDQGPAARPLQRLGRRGRRPRALAEGDDRRRRLQQRRGARPLPARPDRRDGAGPSGGGAPRPADR